LADAFDIVVAGGGIAGLTAGLTAARLGRRTLVLTGDLFGGQILSIEKIDGWPGHPEGIAGYELCPATQEAAVAAGAEVAMIEATELEPDGAGWRVHTETGEEAARAVILATGTSLKTLGVPGEARLFGRGVSQCASCDAPLLRGKPVVVVGGGDSALQEALTLADHASSVTLLVREDALIGQAVYREAAEANARIDIRFNSTVEEILGADRVTGVRLTGGAEIEAAGVFVFIGLQPNAALLADRVTLDGTGRVPVDHCMRTKLRGVCAAGTVRSGAPGRAAASAGDGAMAAVAADRYLADGIWREPE